MNYKILTAMTILLCALTGNAAIDLSMVKAQLESTGVVGEVHGNHEMNSLHVFTFRNPQNFFDYSQFPLVAAAPDVNTQLQQIKRHQKVRLFGRFIDNPAPIRHILVQKLEIISTHFSETDNHPFVPKTPLSEVLDQQELTGRVHAVGESDGAFFLIEYKDLIFPVFVRDPQQKAIVKELFRGDLIRLKYQVRFEPEKPAHLQPSSTAPDAIQVLQRIQDCHGQPIQKTGALVKFPKSPQIINDTYAVLDEDVAGSDVQFTLINFENISANAELRSVLEKAWLEAPFAGIENGRNKLVHRGVVVTAKGQCNVMTQNQANPQILFNLVSDVQLQILSSK